MNERMFNAVRKAEGAAEILANRYGLRRHTFFLSHNDPEVTITRALEAMQMFLEILAQSQPEQATPPEFHPPTLAEMVERASVDELTALRGMGKVTAERMKGLR